MASLSSPSLYTLPKYGSFLIRPTSASVSFRSVALNRRRNLSVRSVSTQVLKTTKYTAFGSTKTTKCTEDGDLRTVYVASPSLQTPCNNLLHISAPSTSGGIAPAISITDGALKHLNKMKADRNEDLCLRIGVKQGGCSGMSYTMEFENKENARPDDSVLEYNGFAIVCDPKSLLFIFGMQLDFSDALIGGGFSFKNPNATQTCGCGKSFAAEM